MSSSPLIEATVRTIQLELGKEPASWCALADILRDEVRPEEEAQTIEIGATLAYAGGDSGYEGRFRCQTVSVWLSGDSFERCRMVASATYIIIGERPWTWQQAHRNRVVSLRPVHSQHLIRRLWHEISTVQPGDNFVEMLQEAINQLAWYQTRLFRQKRYPV